MKIDQKRLLGLVLIALGGALITLGILPMIKQILIIIAGIYLLIRGMGYYGVSFARWQTQAMMWAMRGR